MAIQRRRERTRHTRRIDGWCAELGICRATYYNMPEGMRPFSVKLNKAVVITETPAEWMQRVGAMQSAAR